MNLPNLPPRIAPYWPLSGALLTLGFAPFHLWPLALVALVIWVLAVQQAPTRRAALKGSLLWGTAHGITALYWLPWAFWHDSESLLFAIAGGIPAAVGLAFWVALGYGLAAMLAWPVRHHYGRMATLLGAVMLVVEVLRNLTPFGFPWLPLGAMWGGSVGHNVAPPLLAQLASVGSVQLLSALILGLALLLASLRPQAWYGAAVLLIGIATFGLVRLSTPLPAPDPTQVVQVVQPNQGSQHKWDPELRWQYLAQVLRLASANPGNAAPAPVVVLPETAVPFFLAQTPEARRWLGEAFAPSTTVLTGAVRREETEQGPPRFFNSLQTIQAGNVVASYDKQLLVPFGEFIPLRNLIEALPLPAPLRTLSQSRLDFTHGTAPAKLNTPLGPVVGLICYEGIFPYYVANQVQGARWLANVTNDAWFTGTTALYQHATLQRLRAIELGLPLVRSANTGISLVVDAYGGEAVMLPPNQAGRVEVPLPVALPNTVWRYLINLFDR